MSIRKPVQNLIGTMSRLPQRLISYLTAPMARIFAPSDDNYPEVGVQPFTGDPADKKSL
jgi:hypothetical protein